MIPPLLLIGLATGFVARVKVSLLVGVAFALSWGLAVGIADESLGTAFGGMGIGAANLATGLAFGGFPRWAVTRNRLATR
jgi:hypothetical protein